MRPLALLVVVAFVVCALGTALAEKPKVLTAEGKVTFVCPQKCAIKLKVADDKDLMLLVYPQCPKKDELKKQIGELALHQEIKASYWQCPQTKRLFLTKIEPEAAT